jgi:hypothetical protein
VRAGSFAQRLTVIACLMAVLSGAAALTRSQSKAVPETQNDLKRLVLKDGSFEEITQYQILGTRVRYFSSERHEWEELPEPLIDWVATRKYQQDTSAGASARVKEVAAEAAKEKSREEVLTPTIATGIRLPAEDGVFLLDVYRGVPELDELLQSGAEVKKNMGRNILRGAINPIASSKRTIELAGPHARVQAHAAEPVIYIGTDPDESSSSSSAETAEHFRIVRCEEKKGNRTVGVINIAVYGKVTHKAAFTETRAEKVGTRWVKLMPAAPLAPGEYALVEVLDKGAINQYVWDFGVDPNAPANAATIKAEPDKGAPVLIQKSKHP